MGIGDQGTESTLANALSQVRHFGLKVDAARPIIAEIDINIDGRVAAFAAKGVLARDINLLAQYIDGDRLHRQRKAFLAHKAESSGSDLATTKPVENTALSCLKHHRRALSHCRPPAL